MIEYFKTYAEFINEGISSKDMNKALFTIVKYLNSKIGPLYQLPGFETIKKASGVLLAGVHYIDKNGAGIRFNWAIKETSNEVYSVDFFSPENLFSKPDVTLTLNGESLSRMIPVIVKVYKTHDLNIDIDSLLGESFVYEAEAVKRGRPKGSTNKTTTAKLTKGDVEEDITPDIKKAIKEVKSVPYADPDTIFDDVDAYVEMVLKGAQPSLIVAGAPGVGKCIHGDVEIEIYEDNKPNIIKIKDLFDEISKDEKHSFIINQMYKPKRSFKIKDENGKLIDTLEMVIKTDTIFEVTLENGYSFKAGSKHILKSDSGNKFLENLKQNEDLLLVKGEYITISKIVNLNYEDTVYDISVDSKSMLYQDANGVTHHNTYGITKKIKDYGLKEIEPVEFGEDTTMDDMKAMGIDPNEESDGDWVHIKGATTAFTMYVNLFRYKSKLIVFDDCDSVFSNKDGVNVLKGALDSSEKRIISWGSKALMGKNAPAPPRFNFNGKIIFISNLSLQQLPPALRSRSFVVDINLRSIDVIRRIETIMPAIGLELGLTMDGKKRALDFLRDAVKTESNLEISIRGLINFAKIAQSGVPQWKRLMEIQAINMSLK